MNKVMHTLFLKPVIGCMISIACAHAGADTLDNLLSAYERVASNGRKIHIADIDNDSLMFNKNDGFYTSGLRYTGKYLLQEGQGTTAFGWRIGQELYTASDINLPPELVGPPDHPYAG